MTLSIDSERWCEFVIVSGSIRNRLLRCGDVATSLCDGCGSALCQAHEILCTNCSCVSCLNCDHSCQLDTESLEMGAA